MGANGIKYLAQGYNGTKFSTGIGLEPAEQHFQPALGWNPRPLDRDSGALPIN